MISFKQKWNRTINDKKSLIIAGCDPKVGTLNILEWCEKYLEEVAPYVAGIKPNPAYFQSEEGLRALKMIANFCKKKNLVSIIDYKISDIGSTNEAWIQYAVELGYDAITIAPYAGNIKETIDLCKKHGIGCIMMGLMSNPEFILETDFEKDGEKIWKYRVETAMDENVDALVLGATYKKEDKILADFIEITKEKDILYLVPGIGAQGGEVDVFLENIKCLGGDPKNCMLNIGRALINASDRQAEAKKYQEITESYL